MNWAMFFTHDGKAIHQYHGIAGLKAVRIMRHNVSDWFGSHGCVRLEEAHAAALWHWTPIGTQIYVY
jgi:lipoprotein-anchoring transpeptidase ErfK/SrfK